MKILKQNLTGSNIVIQKLTRPKKFRSKSDCQRKFFVTIVLLKHAKLLQNLSFFQGKTSQNVTLFSLYFFQTLSFWTKFYPKVWRSVSNLVLNPRDLKNCFSELDTLKNLQLKVWSVEEMILQYLTCFKLFNPNTDIFWNFSVKVAQFKTVKRLQKLSSSLPVKWIRTWCFSIQFSPNFDFSQKKFYSEPGKK